MRRPLIGSLAFVAAVSTAAVTQAHIELANPPPRILGNNQKAGPCGMAGSVRGTTITDYQPGATITINWQETVEHLGYYRILFAVNGDAFPNPATPTDFCTPGQEITPGSGIYCLADNIADKDSEADPNYTADVTLPDVTCTNCTLQLVQHMLLADGSSDDLYYKCSDITVGGAGGSGGAGGAAATTTTTTGGATTTTTGAGTGGSGGAGSGYDPYPDDGGGCAVGRGQGTTAAAALGALGLLALLGRRRRTRG